MAFFTAIDWIATRLTNYIVARQNDVNPLPPPPVQQAVPLRNIFNININPANRNPNDVMTVRDHLFHAIYFRVAVMYARIFSRPMRRTLEYFILLKAILFFLALVYIHVSFIKNPSSCLEHVKDWPRDGVLRVEVVPNLDKRLDMYSKSQLMEKSMRQLNMDYFYGIGPKNYIQYFNHKYATNDTYTRYLDHLRKYKLYQKQWEHNIKENYYLNGDQYIVEYSLEYGHLRLSPATRERLHVPVRVVQLDPENNQCFGHKLSKFLLREFLGYDDLLMASVRVIAEKEDNKGFLRNVVTSEHFRFVSTWWTAWSSYPTAFFVMLIFTFTTSMLLRFSHHQIFLFIVDLLQMLEFNLTTHFPIAPLIIVVLALVGMEAIMSEFFNDTTTAFYIIIIVWVADQYYSICCRTDISKKHWLRFFYLYHFAFYAYHHRFSGQNRSLALVSSWLFIQHSMLYFFHRYELPSILARRQVVRRLDGTVDDASLSGVVNGAGNINNGPGEEQRVREMRQLGGNRMRIITWQRTPPLIPQQQQQQQSGQQQQLQQQQVMNDIQQQLQLQQPIIRNHQLYGFRGLLHRSLDTLRRELFGPTPMRIRVQQTDLQHINLGAIQIIPDQLTRAVTPTFNSNVAIATTIANGPRVNQHDATTNTTTAITTASATIHAIQPQTQQDIATVFITSNNFNDTITASDGLNNNNNNNNDDNDGTSRRNAPVNDNGNGNHSRHNNDNATFFTQTNNGNNIVSFNVHITTTTPTTAATATPSVNTVLQPNNVAIIRAVEEDATANAEALAAMATAAASTSTSIDLVTSTTTTASNTATTATTLTGILTSSTTLAATLLKNTAAHSVMDNSSAITTTSTAITENEIMPQLNVNTNTATILHDNDSVTERENQYQNANARDNTITNGNHNPNESEITTSQQQVKSPIKPK